MDDTRPTAKPAPLVYRPLVPVVCAFAAGILLREYGPLPHAAAWAAAGAALAAFPLPRAARRPGLALFAVYLLVAAAGWARLESRSPPRRPAAPWLPTWPKRRNSSRFAA